MVFTASEMVGMYRDAKDKKEQIAIFCDTEGMKEEEIIKILLDNGIRGQQLPRKKRQKLLPVPEEKAERTVEDALIEAIEQEKEENAIDPEESTEEVQPRETVEDFQQMLLEYIRELKADREALLEELAEVEGKLREIAAAADMPKEWTWGR